MDNETNTTVVLNVRLLRDVESQQYYWHEIIRFDKSYWKLSRNILKPNRQTWLVYQQVTAVWGPIGRIADMMSDFMFVPGDLLVVGYRSNLALQTASWVFSDSGRQSKTKSAQVCLKMHAVCLHLRNTRVKLHVVRLLRCCANSVEELNLCRVWVIHWEKITHKMLV